MVIGSWRTLPRAARLLLGVLLVDFLGSGLTHAFLVVYLHRVRGFPLGTVGLLIGLTSLVSLAVAVPSGALVARHGARRMGIIANVLIVAGEIVLAFASNASMAVLSVSLTGLGFGLAWTAFSAFAVSLVPADQRTRYFGIEFGLVNLGIGVGGVVGGLVLSGLTSFQMVYLIDAATTLATTVLLLGPLRHYGAPAETRTDEVRNVGDDTSDAGATVAPSYREVLRTRGVLPLFAFTAATTFVGYAQLNSGMVAYATDVAGVGTRWIGVAVAANTGIIVVLQIVLLPVIEGARRTRAMALAALVWAVAWGCLALAGALSTTVASGPLVVACAGVFGIGEVMLTPLIPALVNDLADDRTRGRATALNSLGQQLPKVVGPPFSGAMLAAGFHGAYVAVLVSGAAGCALFAVTVLSRQLPAAVDCARPEPVTTLSAGAEI